MSKTIQNQEKTLFSSVEKEISIFDSRLLNEISPSSKALCTILQEIFKAGGKRIRPALSFLFHKAINPKQDFCENIFLIAEISELIHTASLVHDDIIDNSLIRRGKPTTNSKWNNAVTVISGDFMFARAAVNLGEIANNDITALFARVLENLCDGEISQVEKKFSTEVDWDYYYDKTYKKTASLFEAACLAPAIANEASDEIKYVCTEFGKNLGLAFQIFDDILDFTAEEEILGKPNFADLTEGQITIPVIITLEKLETLDQEKHRHLIDLIKELSTESRSDKNKETIKKIIKEIKAMNGIEESILIAEQLINKAIDSLTPLPNSIYKTDLINIAKFVINRAN
jgi:all-trans-nonaprenyl-diphosphate synthase